ncbi:hypothetical protein BGZ97_006577, partial [Linnemannia gamsii]
MYSTTPYEKVFDILELTTLIADGLTQHDLALCCCVNKSFFATFTPHLWHSITILHNDLIPKFQTPEARAGLLRNGHHIRVLRSQSVELLEPFLESGITCTNLVSLDTQIKFYAPLWRSRSTEGTQSWDPRSSAMRSKVRRGSVGTGQQQRPVPGFGYTDPAPASSAIGVFTAPSVLKLENIAPVPVSSVMFASSSVSALDAALPTPIIGSGNATLSGFGFGSTSISASGASLPASTSVFGGVTAPSALGFGYATSVSASSHLFDSSPFSTPTGPFGGAAGQRPKAVTEKSEIELILAAILERNPRL